MTGYGRVVRAFGETKITIEVRALNSKLTDIRFKMPMNYKEKEIDLRRTITEQAERGKIDVNINVESLSGEGAFIINHELFKRYHAELTQLKKELGIESGDILQAIARLPNVAGGEDTPLSDEQWAETEATLNETLKEFTNFRLKEGEAMEKDLRLRNKNILEKLDDVKKFEGGRMEKMRQRMRQNLDEYMNKENVDENRFEQEVLFYLEKIDITEEKVRLAQHIRFLEDTLNDKKNTSKGKTLNFIAQEMGREINTLGSKAYSADIQHVIVAMKDELEKMKEMIANVV